MKFKSIACSCAVVILATLPGCGTLIDWGRETVNQAKKTEQHNVIPRRNTRSVHAYDQLDTVAIFDAIWLSDAVRTAYSDAYSLRFGKSAEKRNTILRRQLEENQHFISFYVLSLYEMSLGDELSQWAVFLDIDGTNYAPIEIKQAELNPEYQTFFGNILTRFKVPYQINFDARNIDDDHLLDGATQQMVLHFRSTKKDITLAWYFDENGSLTKNKKEKKA